LKRVGFILFPVAERDRCARKHEKQGGRYWRVEILFSVDFFLFFPSTQECGSFFVVSSFFGLFILDGFWFLYLQCSIIGVQCVFGKFVLVSVVPFFLGFPLFLALFSQVPTRCVPRGRGFRPERRVDP